MVGSRRVHSITKCSSAISPSLLSTSLHCNAINLTLCCEKYYATLPSSTLKFNAVNWGLKYTMQSAVSSCATVLH